MSLEQELLECGITERGNTSLRNVENGSLVFYKNMDTNSWLEVIYMVNNHPAWNISIVTKTLSEIRTHIEENFNGMWVVERNNIGINVEYAMPVDLEYVMEEVRNQLHIFRASKSVDTVTFIHNFLESKDWTMDITDIETLRQSFDEA